MTPEELLDWAEVVKHAVMGEELVKVLEFPPRPTPMPPAQPAPMPTWPQPHWPRPLGDCGCPMGTICMNTACPRRSVIWSGGPSA